MLCRNNRKKIFSIKNQNCSLFKDFLVLASSLVVFFIIAPLSGLFLNLTGSDFLAVVVDADVQNSIVLTLTVSMAGALFFSVLGVPLAYFLARHDFFGKRLILGVIDLPIIIPHSAAGIAILTVISPDSLLGSFAATIGLRLVGNPLGIMLAMSYVSIPFLINSARNGFVAVPLKLEKAALSLGASPARVFFTISIPLAWRSIISGLIMMWARGLSEFGAVIIVAYHPMITPVLIFERFTSFGLAYARPVSALFVLVCLVVFIFLRLLSDKNFESR